MTSIKKIPDFWLRRSLRFWLTTGMLMSLAPIFISAIAGHFLYSGLIIQPLTEVASKQRQVLQPLQKIQLSLWDASVSVVDHAIDGQAQHREAYQAEAEEITTGFETLIAAMNEQGYSPGDVLLAKEEWHLLDSLSTSLLADGTISANPAVGEEVENFEALIDLLAHRLETIHDAIRIRNEQTHQEALTSLALSEVLVLIGLFISILGAVCGVALINRSLVSSMNRLAAGSIRFTQGDRAHQIQVQIPRELANVATAFNTMTDKIRAQEKRLEDLARKDGLTGLYNRRSFDEMLAEEVQRSHRHHRSLSLIMGDVDNFKSFNDSYGHQIGDDVLRLVSESLASNVREVDKVFRFGGEEFIILMPDASIEDAADIAERVRKAVEVSPIKLDENNKGHVTISLGVAVISSDTDSGDAILKRADEALYRAKESGRNRVILSTG